jgi:hypothetical protein
MSIASEFMPNSGTEYPTVHEIIELDDKLRKVNTKLLLRMPLSLKFRLLGNCTSTSNVTSATSATSATKCRNIICERRAGVVTTDNNMYLLCNNENNGLMLFKFDDTKLTIQSVGRSNRTDLHMYSECFVKEFGFNDH